MKLSHHHRMSRLDRRGFWHLKFSKRRNFMKSCFAIVTAAAVLFITPYWGRAQDSHPRDFTGVWSTAGSSSPINDITDHLLPGEEISFTPYGAQRYKTIDHAKDATNTCGPAGYMRGMQTPLMP